MLQSMTNYDKMSSRNFKKVLENFPDPIKATHLHSTSLLSEQALKKVTHFVFLCVL